MNSSPSIPRRFHQSIIVAVFVTMMSSAPLDRRSSAQQAAEPSKPTALLRAFKVRNVDAQALLDTVSQLTPNAKDLRLAVDQRNNSILARGDVAELDAIAKLVETLDVVDSARERVINVFSIQHINPVSSLKNVLDMFASRENVSIEYYDKGQKIVAVGPQPALEEVDAVLKRLDEPPSTESTHVVKDSAPLRLRVAWLATGMKNEKPAPPPADLDVVVAELAGVGIEAPQLVAQLLINSNEGDRPFQALGEAVLDDEPCVIEVSGVVLATHFFGRTGDEQRKLEIRIAVTRNDGESARRICNLETTISAPLGHSVVLGATPALDKTSVFVIQLMPQSQ